MNSETTVMTKADLPGIRIELYDEGVRLVIEKKIDRKIMKFDVAYPLNNMPSLIGFEIKPIFRK